MNKKINIYFIILLFSFFKSIISSNFVALSNAMYVIGDILLFAILAIFIKNKKITLDKKDIILIGLLTIAQTLGFFYSCYLNTFNKYIYKFIEFILGYLIMYICVKNIKVDTEEIDQIYKMILWVAIISCVYAMIFQLGKDVFAMSSNNNFTMVNVYKSLWGHRNHFALILVAGIISSTYFYMKNNRKKYMIGLIILFSINLFLTFSRACYLMVVIFFLVYYLAKKNKDKKKLQITAIALIIVLILIIILYFCIPQLKGFVDNYIIRQRAGLTGRDTIWKNAMKFIDLPTFLVGRSMGTERIILQSDTVGGSTGLHNMYLTYFINGGIALLLFLGVIIVQVIKQIYTKIESNDMQRFLIASMVALFIYAFFEVTYVFGLGLQTGLQTYFCITLPLLCINASKKKKD